MPEPFAASIRRRPFPRAAAASPRRWLRPSGLLLALAGLAPVPVLAVVAPDTLYGASDSAIVTFDQGDGSVTPLPEQPTRFAGLAFDSSGRLYATGCTLFPGCSWLAESLLFELDPRTGAILDTIGPVTDAAGSRPAIHALAVQPGTDVLYGFGILASPRSRIWTIDPATALATPIASEVPSGCQLACSTGLGFDFAPDGTLYHGAGNVLMTLDPATGTALGSVPFNGATALAVRSDGTLFGMLLLLPRAGCVGCLVPPVRTSLFTIDPPTGARTAVGIDEGAGGPDLAFSPIVVIAIDIDIVPGSEVNVLNPMSRGLVPVAVLGSEDFDVADVDATTLAFGPEGARLAHRKGPHFRDVDHDGLTDILAHYASSDTGIAFGDMHACVTGERLDGTPFEGCDSIATLPPACGEGFGLALVLPVLVTLTQSGMRRARRSADVGPGGSTRASAPARVRHRSRPVGPDSRVRTRDR